MIEYEELERVLADFAEKRDWDQFHTPKNLALALVGEVGELCELLQWSSDTELADMLAADGLFRQSVSDELADVLIYLVRIASVMRIDLDQAVESKIVKNASRYPADEVRGSSEKRP